MSVSFAKEQVCRKDIEDEPLRPTVTEASTGNRVREGMTPERWGRRWTYQSGVPGTSRDTRKGTGVPKELRRRRFPPRRLSDAALDDPRILGWKTSRDQRKRTRTPLELQRSFVGGGFRGNSPTQRRGFVVGPEASSSRTL